MKKASQVDIDTMTAEVNKIAADAAEAAELVQAKIDQLAKRRHVPLYPAQGLYPSETLFPS